MQEVPSAAMTRGRCRRSVDRVGRVWRRPTFLLGMLVVLAGPALAVDDADWDDDIDAELALMDRIAAVNEGDLRFVDATTAAGSHVHDNRIRITPASLDEGWIDLTQCHTNLDPVPRAQILFRAGGVRDLRVESASNIGRAWVEDHSVQLEDVAEDARLCILAQSQALQDLGDGYWRLRNGPYMRRFLDGYYPMQVALDIRYPAERIRLVAQSPVSQPGFQVSAGEGAINVAATFEGRLITCFDFCEPSKGDCAALAPACAGPSGSEPN